MKTLDYNPNRRSRDLQTIQITFTMWEYSCTHEIEVSGNCRGISIISFALEMLDTKLYKEQGSHYSLELHNTEDDVLEVTDEDDKGIEFLSDMVTKCEIVKLEQA